MTKKTWIVWALFLMLPGIVGIGIHFVLNDSIDHRIAESTEKNLQDTAVKEYLQSYEKWSHLTAAEKANNPWGFGEYGGDDIEKQLEKGQYDRLVSDLPDLEKGISHYPDQLADVLYGLDWQREVESYHKERFAAEVVLIGSIFLLAGGGLILTAGIIKSLIDLIMKKRDNDEDVNDSVIPEETETIPNTNRLVQSSPEKVFPEDNSNEESDCEATEEKGSEAGYFQSAKEVTGNYASPSEDDETASLPMKPPEKKSGLTPSIQKDSYFGWAIDAEDSTELDTLMTTEPLTKELTELTEEVSAIRQFAAQQQDQMRKLQDGYDWMIIRRFCLRVIRCIDNIDDRILNLQEQEDIINAYLEDIRDELIFALESSGIEQYKPDLNITFKGLEKYAEAVRERILTEEADRVGCIAEVARPGYQYLVNDDDVKIVRCAQVKLYEAN